MSTDGKTNKPDTTGEALSDTARNATPSSKAADPPRIETETPSADTRRASTVFSTKIVREYCGQLVNGSRAGGELIRAAAERTLAEIESGPIVYDWGHLDRVVTWIENLQLPDYEKAVKLEPFQVWILSQIEARKRADGLPASSLVLIECARGGAKTYLAGMLLAFHLYHSTTRQQLDLGSTSASGAGRDAAEIIREFSIQVGEPLEPRYAVGGCAVRNTENRSEVNVIPPDPEKWHGRRSRIAFLDEASHVQKPVMVRAMTGAAKRPDGQVICFTTPHHDREVPYYSIRDQVVGELLEGHSKDHEVALCWTIDDEDPVEFTEELCAKANPGLGVTIQVEDIRRNFDSMVTHGNGASRSDFVRQHYARFDSQVSSLIDLQDWERCKGSPVLPAGETVYMGIDLSRGAAVDSNRTDVCSVTLARTDPTGVIHVKARHFLPEHRLEYFGHRSKLPLLDWVDQGHLVLCPGRIIDPDMIEAEIRAAVDEFTIPMIGYDTWTFPRDRLHKLETVDRWPFYGRAKAEHVVPATEGLVDKVRQGKILHDGDPVLERALKNCRVRNYQGGRRPDKDPSRSMIDPLMSLIYCLSGMFEQGGDHPSIYESDDIAC